MFFGCIQIFFQSAKHLLDLISEIQIIQILPSHLVDAKFKNNWPGDFSVLSIIANVTVVISDDLSCMLIDFNLSIDSMKLMSKMLRTYNRLTYVVAFVAYDPRIQRDSKTNKLFKLAC